MKIKKRLDLILQEKYPEYSRNQIQSFIMQNKAYVEGHPVNKAGTLIEESSDISLNVEIPKYVCRAGFKMEKALEFFNIDPTELVILDAGLSTGGFTDCLLQKGAKKIFGVDVGIAQVHEKIRSHPNVVVMEKTNLRHLMQLPNNELVDLVTLDLSFISVLKVMDAVNALLKPKGSLIVLIKPQFEARREEVGKGGIIKDPAIHEKVVNKLVHELQNLNFECKGVTESPITGTMGNKEFLAYFVKN